MYAVIDCGSLPDIPNGNVSYSSGTTFGSVAMYSCEPGYMLMGSLNHTCQADGDWSDYVPFCESKEFDAIMKTHITLCVIVWALPLQ